VWGGTAGGTANALTLTPAVAASVYVAGYTIKFLASATNTGAATVNVSGLGVKNLRRQDGSALSAGDITNGYLYQLVYDGTNFVTSELDVVEANSVGTAQLIDGGVTNAKLSTALQAALLIQGEHSWELNGNYPSLSFPLIDIDSVFLAPYNLTIQSVWIWNQTAGSSGITEYDLKVASPGGTYSSILSTTGKITSTATSGIWTDSGSVVGPQTGVTKPVISTSAITAGQAIRFDLIQAMVGATDARIRLFYIKT
jgi:hypothetical protein